MKKGFTMIELIFVIVILGILAAVAVPKLAATRDDAEIAKTATNIVTIISDLGSYYTAKGAWPGSGSGNVTVDDNIMKQISLVPKAVKAKKDACLTVKKLIPENGMVEFEVGSSNLCSAIWSKMPALKSIYESMTAADGVGAPADNTSRWMKFGGTGVSFE